MFHVSSLNGIDPIANDVAPHFLHLLKLTLPASSFPKAKRRPIDFVFVIDKSSSMTGTKLALVLSCCEAICRDLSIPEDRFAIVSFNQAATIHTSKFISADTKGQNELAKILQTIHASGSTNISAAFEEGYNILRSTTRQSAMLFFTDGQATCGKYYSDFKIYIDIVRRGIQSPITFASFGFGEGADQKMLKLISSCTPGESGGSFFQIDSEKDIPTAFGEAVGAISNMEAWNLHLTLYAQPGCKIMKIDTELETMHLKPQKQMQVQIGTMFREETKNVLLTLNVAGGRRFPMGQYQPLLDCHVSYMDASGITHINEYIGTTGVCRSNQSVLASKETSEAIEDQVTRIEAARALREAEQKAENGDYSSAIQVLTAALQTLPNETVLQKSIRGDIEKTKNLLSNETTRRQGTNMSSTMGRGYSQERGGSFMTGEQQDTISATHSGSDRYYSGYE